MDVHSESSIEKVLGRLPCLARRKRLSCKVEKGPLVAVNLLLLVVPGSDCPLGYDSAYIYRKRTQGLADRLE
jgi:hypothetical protein